MSWLLNNFIANLLLPPLSLLLLALAGVLLWRQRPALARRLIGASLALLWLLATPVVPEFLLHCLENPASALPAQAAASRDAQSAGAIVVLGGGLYAHAPEYAGDTVSLATLQRIRYAASLARSLHKPILVSGGSPTGSAQAEADLMRQVLQQEFDTPVQWLESGSDNTYQSARNCQRILDKPGLHKILLVTHAWHMPRASRAFARAGFAVIPAPTAFTTRYKIDALAFMPNADALLNSRIFLHELIGMLWYRLKS